MFRAVFRSLLVVTVILASKSAALDVYFIGNSLTDVVNYRKLDSVATIEGYTHNWGRHMIPGAPLSWLWDNASDGMSESPYGSWGNALTNYAWDAVSLQPYDRALSDDSIHIKKFIDTTIQRSPQCSFFIYGHWVKITSSVTTGAEWNTEWLKTYTGSGTNISTRDYFNKLTDAVRSSNPEKKVFLVPIGDVMYELNQRMMNGEVPEYTSILQAYSDGVHLNAVGSYIAGCTFFATVYQKDPRGTAFYSGISSGLATIIQDAVWEVVSNHTYTWPAAKPLITLQPQPRSKVAGDSVVFSVSAESIPPLTYAWRKNSVALVSDARISGTAGPQLTITSLAEADSGLYDCIVTNSAGQDTSDTARLSVCSFPQISAPSNQSVTAGDSARFSVTLSAGQTPVTWSWQRKPSGGSWTVISGIASASYAFVTTMPMHGDSLRALASNICGTDTSNAALLAVIEPCVPVTVQTHPQSQTVNEARSVTFSVTAETVGTPPFGYQWQRKPSGSSSWATVTGATAAIWTFTVLKTMNGDSIRAVLDNSCGTVTSRHVHLAVIDTIAPVPVADLTLTSTGTSGFNVQWTSPESSSSDADSVYVYYSSSGFPTPTLEDRQLAGAYEVRQTPGIHQVQVSGLLPGTTWYVAVWISDSAKNMVLADTAMITIPPAGTIVNPIIVRATALDSFRVQLVLTGYSTLPSAGDSQPYADSVGVWYRAGSYTASVNWQSGYMVKYALNALKAAGSQFTDSIEIATGNDSIFYFSPSVLWRLTGRDSIPPFVQEAGDSALMRDRSQPINPCIVYGSYSGTGENATITVGNVANIDRNKVLRAIVECSFNESFDPSFFTWNISTDSMHSEAQDGVYAVQVQNSLFAGPMQTVYCSIRLIGTNGVMSDRVDSTFPVGTELPANLLRLSALSRGADRIELTWDSAEVIDSVRIACGLTVFPLGQLTGQDLEHSITVAADSSHIMVRGLNPQTHYFFAAQIQKNGIWSAITVESRSSAVTAAASQELLDNTARIDSAYFDTTTNSIVVAWHFDTTGSTEPEFGIVYTVASVYSRTGTSPSSALPIDRNTMVSRIYLGSAIVFDTTLTVGIWVRRTGGMWIASTDSSEMNVKTPSYTWQAISYFVSGVDSVRAFNSSVQLWHSGQWSLSPVTDTLVTVPFTAPSPYVMLSKAVRFRAAHVTPKFYFGMHYNSVPEGLAIKDLSLYQVLNDTTVLKIDSSTIDSVHARVQVFTNYLQYPFVILIDTTQIVETDSIRLISSPRSLIAVENQQVRLECVAEGSNLAYQWQYLNQSLRWTNIDGRDFAEYQFIADPASQREIFRVRITSGNLTEVSEPCTVLVLIASPVSVDSSRTASLRMANKWYPMYADIDLANKAPSSVISVLGGGNTWTYNKSNFRMIRWLAKGGSWDWVEYEDNAKDDFLFEPGRLVWVCASKPSTFNLGGGTTIPLDRCFTIELAPRTWTDFGSPMPFSVYLDDILDSSDTDCADLPFYSWYEDTVFSNELLYYKQVHGSVAETRKFLDNKSVGYSVYNSTNSYLRLRIPPVSTGMAPFRLPLAKMANPVGSSWNFAIETWMDGLRLNKVYCCITDELLTPAIPLAPSFGGCGVYLVSASGSTDGIVSQDFKNRGVQQVVAFYNRTKEPRTIDYRIITDRPPQGIVAGLVDKESSLVFSGSIRVSPGTVEYRIAAAGTPEFISSSVKNLKMNAGLRQINPNPFHLGTMFTYSVPISGVDRLKIAVYDLSGKEVWSFESRNIRVPGDYSVVWNGTSQGGSLVRSGTYVVRSAFTSGTSRIMSENLLTKIR